AAVSSNGERGKPSRDTSEQLSEENPSRSDHRRVLNGSEHHLLLPPSFIFPSFRFSTFFSSLAFSAPCLSLGSLRRRSSSVGALKERR
ncbi:uncharacterized, partial [Tachysurus ichikawai]